MKIFFMMAYHYWPNPNPVLVETIAILERKGLQVDIGIGEGSLLDLETLSPAYDLYILKSKAQFWTDIAGVLSAQGAHILDSYQTRLLTNNKTLLTQQLKAAGIPTPQTWVTANLALLEALIAQTPLIIKPVTGGRGQGIFILRTKQALEALPELTSPVIVQRYLEHLPEDVKIYVIGKHAFGFRKQFSEESFKQPGMPCILSEEMRRLALAAGQACGATLYGVDLIETPSGPVVVDLNGFPSYRAIPEASQILANHILVYLEKSPRA